MRKFPLISISFLGLALSFGLAACDGDDGNGEGVEATAGDGDGDPGDGDGDPGDGDGDPGDGDGTPGDGDGDTCIPAPDECLLFVECIGAVVPDQQASTEAKYGAEGSCWCGSTAEANECFATCVTQTEKARESKPTEQACHKSSCTLDELDPTQPYGPIMGGSCPIWDPGAGTTYPQVPINNPSGVSGSYCSPPCTGIAKTCVQHPQTSADGTCSLIVGGQEHCSMRCWVDSTVIGGTQCQCGATCKPHGGPDGEGNQRGTCLF